MAQQHPTTFTLLSYNINDEAPSISKPLNWTLQDSHAALLSLVMEHDPDVLCLQECFGGIPPLLEPMYDLHGQAPSHRGVCLLLTRKGSRVQPAGPAFKVGPCVVLPAQINAVPVYLACGHLYPFGENAAARASQLSAVVRKVPADAPIVFAGDTNMREHESVAEELGLQDAWKEAGCDPEQRWTWNTRINKYYPEGREYTARYDRVLMRDCEVLQFGIVANQPCSDRPTHFLSDHFGVAAMVKVVDAQHAPHSNGEV